MTLHDEAESIAIEQVRYWREEGVRPAEAFALVGGRLPAGDYQRVLWDDVHYAVMGAWLKLDGAPSSDELKRWDRLVIRWLQAA